jgi:predicted nucleotidyltransferase
MKVAAIITEYNPFHNGHEYQIKKTREILGEDTAIIAIMSGNFTQRGEPAIADKLIRASAAVECGVDLVLELPFPYSMTSAEFFARSGVHIANRLGIVDHLVFGSECGDIAELSEIAENMTSQAFLQELSERERSESAIGHAVLCETVYNELYGNLPKDFFTSNNILALEYIKALIVEGSSIAPVTIKREGGNYTSEFTEGTTLQSATAIRAMINANDSSALEYVPEKAKAIYEKAILSGEMPIYTDRLDSAVISYFRLNSPVDECSIHDAGGGLYNRLCDLSMTASTITSLTSMTETKKYTKTRIKRAIWNTYFGVTSSDVKALPAYTQVLAMDSVGRSLLKRIKKTSDFPIITKPSDYTAYSQDVVTQAERAHKADSIFALAHKKAISGNFSLRLTPYVKK